ncbi:Riboflavin biosynthesis protein RibF [Chlamydiales bacterium STE3]|nr:Riboflavin biosynthesis protein RibF [Chlamydiales bacterium STE3]
MPVHYSLDPQSQSSQQAVLTVGNFDGVHLGHQAILKQISDLARCHSLIPAAITFKNHPSTIFSPNHPLPLLTSAEHKLELLKRNDLEKIYMLDFDEKFANQSAEEFLSSVMQVQPFRYLILGYDAKLGKARQGDRDWIHYLASKMHFIVEYLPPVTLKSGEIISSSAIRKCVQENDLKKAETFLGRPYSIYAPIKTGYGKGKNIGFPTANMEICTLCHPGFGVYAVTAIIDNQKKLGIANLGFAPTVRNDHKPLLEVHLFDTDKDYYGHFAEVIFHELIRPEKRFETVELLKDQIQKDILLAKKILKYAP